MDKLTLKRIHVMRMLSNEIHLIGFREYVKNRWNEEEKNNKTDKLIKEVLNG